MSVILVLILISILVAGGFLLAFIWAIRHGQYEDTFSPSVRILFDNQIEGEEKSVKTKSTDQDKELNTQR